MNGSESLAVILFLLLAAPLLYALCLRLHGRISPTRGGVIASLFAAAAGLAALVYSGPHGHPLSAARDLFWGLYWIASGLVEWRQLRRKRAGQEAGGEGH